MSRQNTSSDEDPKDQLEYHADEKKLSASGARRKHVSLFGLFSSSKPNVPDSPVTGNTSFRIKGDHKQKIVFLGDASCGKTCFHIKLCSNVFPTENIPITCDTCAIKLDIDDATVEVSLWDTGGRDDCYDRLRPLSFVQTDVFFVCFSIGSPDSLANIRDKWIPEIRYYGPPGTPVFLLGLKKDLRDEVKTTEKYFESSPVAVTEEQAEKCRREIGAVAYYECSAKTGEGVRETLEGAVKEYFVLQHALKKKKEEEMERKNRSLAVRFRAIFR